MSFFSQYFNLKSTTTKFTIALNLFSTFNIIYLIIFENTKFEANLDNIIFRSIVSYLFIFVLFIVLSILAKVALKEKYFIPAHLLISVNIIFLLIHPTNSFFLIGLTVIATFLSNRLIRYKGFPVFNPTAAGILISFLTIWVLSSFNFINETLFISWWGAPIFKSIQDRNILILIVSLGFLVYFLYSSYNFRKNIYAMSFLGFYILFQFFYFFFQNNDASLAISNSMRFLTGNVLFLALIMLIEPKTSPIKVHQQVAFGIVAALVLTIFIALSRSGSLIIGDLSLTALTEVLTILSVNLIFFIKKAIPSKPNVNQL